VTTPITAPPIADPPPEMRPGHGYGDRNHIHTGPPGSPP
jgi:hypothetical protein